MADTVMDINCIKVQCGVLRNQMLCSLSTTLLFFVPLSVTFYIVYVHSPPKEMQHLVEWVPEPQNGVNDPKGSDNY